MTDTQLAALLAHIDAAALLIAVAIIIGALMRALFNK